MVRNRSRGSAMGSKAGLSFMQRRFEGRKEPKDYKRIDAACRGRNGDPSCSAPLLTGRASSPEQQDTEDGGNWGGWESNSSKDKVRRGSQKSLGAATAKTHNDWDNSWGDGWNSGSNSDTSPTKVPSSPLTEMTGGSIKGARHGASGKGSSSVQGKKKGAKEGLLIDFDEEKIGGGHDWNSKWDDEPWEILNKKD